MGLILVQQRLHPEIPKASGRSKAPINHRKTLAMVLALALARARATASAVRLLEYICLYIHIHTYLCADEGVSDDQAKCHILAVLVKAAVAPV